VGAAEGRRDALFTVAGGLAGALGYTLAYPLARAWLIAPIDLGKPTLHSLTGVAPGLAGLAFGAAMIGVAFLLPQRPGAREERPQEVAPAAR
jgi:hypothetical protein